MIFSEIQAAMASRLSEDAYFSAAPGGVPVASENQPAIRKTVQDALNTGSGVIAIVERPGVQRGEGQAVTLSFTLLVIENTERNPSGKTAMNICAKAWALLDGYEPPECEFASPFRVKGYNEVDSGDGLVIWQLDVETFTNIYVLGETLAEADGDEISSSNGESMVVSRSQSSDV